MSEAEPKRPRSQAQIEASKRNLAKGNPKAFTKTPAAGGAGRPRKSGPKPATVRASTAGAPPARPKARRQSSTRKGGSSAPAKRGSGGGFFRGLLDL